MCVFNDIDSVRTLIISNRDFQTTEFYCYAAETASPNWRKYAFLDTLVSSNSFVELLNYAPENISVSGHASIDGEGTFLKGAGIWGNITLESPMSFIFEKPITIIPADPWSMPAIDDSSTAEMINSSLISGEIYVDFTNRSPGGGDLALLISDSTIFPLFLDSLITGTWQENRQYQMDTWGYYFKTNPNKETTDQPWIWDSLGLEIDSISFTAIDPSNEEPKALEVKFYHENNLQFFIGRLFELKFPATDLIDDTWGYVIPSFTGMHTSSSKIDTTLLAWLITDQPRNSTAMITFDKSPIRDDFQYMPMTSQITNAIEIQAYLTLKLDSGGLK
jgi:hypothetical protein